LAAEVLNESGLASHAFCNTANWHVLVTGTDVSNGSAELLSWCIDATLKDEQGMRIGREVRVICLRCCNLQETKEV
jgi:hypothetical protein